MSKAQEKALKLTNEMLIDATKLCETLAQGGNKMDILVVAMVLAINHHAEVMRQELTDIYTMFP
jgi:hypothetical protein